MKSKTTLCAIWNFNTEKGSGSVEVSAEEEEGEGVHVRTLSSNSFNHPAFTNVRVNMDHRTLLKKILRKCTCLVQSSESKEPML